MHCRNLLLSILHMASGSSLPIELCTDWEQSIFEKRTLRFKDVTNYHIDEIPFSGQPTILDIAHLGQSMKTWGDGRNQITVLRNTIEMHTNAGKRTIEYAACEWINSK